MDLWRESRCQLSALFSEASCNFADILAPVLKAPIKPGVSLYSS